MKEIMKTPHLTWMMFAMPLLLTGCPDGGGGGIGEGGAGSTIVYLADQDTNGVNELYRATTGAKINPALGVGRTVSRFARTPDRTAVIYIADQDTPAVFELYRVNLATGVSTKLHVPLVGGQDVTAFSITPDGTSVVYLADQDTDDTFELYRTLLDTTLANTKLNAALDVGEDVIDFKVIPNGSGVIYRADQRIDTVNELFHAVFSAPAPTTALNAVLAPGRNVSALYEVAPDSSSVVYVADQDTVGANELYQVILGAPGTSTKLHPAFTTGENVTAVKFTANSRSVVYIADQETDDLLELYRTVLATGVTPSTNRKLSGTITGNEDVTAFDLAPDSSSVVYRADQDIDETCLQ